MNIKTGKKIPHVYPVSKWLRIVLWNMHTHPTRGVHTSWWQNDRLLLIVSVSANHTHVRTHARTHTNTHTYTGTFQIYRRHLPLELLHASVLLHICYDTEYNPHSQYYRSKNTLVTEEHSGNCLWGAWYIQSVYQYACVYHYLVCWVWSASIKGKWYRENYTFNEQHWIELFKLLTVLY